MSLLELGRNVRLKNGEKIVKERKLEMKYKALLELEKGMSNKEVANSFGVPANTLST